MNCAARKVQGQENADCAAAVGQELRQENQQQQQQRCELKQYLLMNYYLTNKSVIIGTLKYDWLSQLINDTLFTPKGSILTPAKQDKFLLEKIDGCGSLENNKVKKFANNPTAKVAGKQIINNVVINQQTEGITSKYDLASNLKQQQQQQQESFRLPQLSVNRRHNKVRISSWPHSIVKSLVLLSLTILVLQQYAVLCYWFGRSQRSDNFGLSGYNYPQYQPTMTPNNFWYNNINHNSHMRSLDPSTILPSSANMENSFILNDPSANVPSESTSKPHLEGWPSILPSFLNPSQQRPQQQPDTLDKHIKSILVPRVSGTEGNVKVRNYIVDSLKANDYHVQLDEFIDNTPIGKVKFANIIADSNPNACRQLVIACHYDSKMMEGFLGAIDSAVPCSIMLKMSEKFSKSFRQSEEQSDKESLGIRFIFFDGEEAFENWGPTDSLYGSRHLAAKWERSEAPSQCGVRNELKRIELFLILDLIGSSDTQFVMYNRELKHHYNDMMKYEREYLNKSGVSLSGIRGLTAFKNRYMPIHTVEDDHTPFLRRGVPILSLLANPFPRVWHQVSDNYEAIDFVRTRRILHVLEEFVSNYKH